MLYFQAMAHHHEEQQEEIADAEVDAIVPDEHISPESLPILGDHEQEEYVRKAVATLSATLSKHLSSFRLTRADILRVTAARHVLWCGGRAMRGTAYSDDLHQYSQVAETIAQFWSHSWHGPSWSKISLLSVICNGCPALLCGTLGVAIATVLVLQFGASHLWTLVAGLLVSCLTFIFWQPSKRVFVDKICINQADDRRRLEGVVNVCAFAKRSESMLVCWDGTYAQRLWCVLEMAAFIKTHEEAGLLLRNFI